MYETSVVWVKLPDGTLGIPGDALEAFRVAHGGDGVNAGPTLGAMPPENKPSLPVTGDPEADALLVEDSLARLIGMLLDQHIR